MNRLALAIILITSTVILSFSSLGIMKNTNEKMLTHLETVTKYANEENYTALNNAAKEATAQWEKEKPLLNVLIGQKETNEITGSLQMIEYFALEGNKESVLMYIYQCKTDLERIKSTNEPSLSTIL